MPPLAHSSRPSRARPRVIRASVAALALGTLTVALLAAESQLTERDERRFTPVGEAVDVNGTTMNLDCRGTGSPTVVLEAGLGESSLTWSEVAPAVAAHTRVCAYDRPGYGWSEAAEGPHDADAQAQRLRALLAAADEPGPYVLVAHSYGSLIARLLAAAEPEAVAGLLLVEPTNDRTAAADGAAFLPSLVTRAQAVASRLGLARPFSAGVARDNAGAPLPPDVASRATFLYRAQAVDTAAAELGESGRSAEQASDAALSDELSVVVLLDSSASPEDQRRFGSLTGSTSVALLHGGHYLHYAHPDRISGEILELVDGARATSAGG